MLEKKEKCVIVVVPGEEMQINKVNAVTYTSFFKTNKYAAKPQKAKISFEGKPQSIHHYSVYSSDNPAIYTYNLFRNGSYLDSHDDSFNPSYKAIRKSNFEPFYKLQSEKSKRIFVDNYKKTTGFPDLKEVSKKIENEFISTIKNAESFFDDEEYKCISAGYDPTCSVGKGFAFPGSDLDKSYIILKGCDFDWINNEIVQNFSSYLWNNTDQRILSYNHDTSFPTIMTVKQVKDLLDEISLRISDIRFDKKEMQNLVENEYIDLEKAAKFNILVSDYFPTKNKYKNSDGRINKEDVKNFAYFAESFRDGKEVVSTDESKELKEELEDNVFYKYSNVAQIRAMKKAVESGKEQKTKILKRIALQNEFNNYSIDKQYDFIINLIKYCCEDQDEFQEYFRNDRNVKERYKPLLARLTKGDRNDLYIPEFKKMDDGGYNMKYGRDDHKNVNLYTGYAPNVLWIDSDDNKDIERVQENIDYIKRLEKFSNIDLIQSPFPIFGISDNFYLIQYRTGNGRKIQEMRV